MFPGRDAARSGASLIRDRPRLDAERVTILGLQRITPLCYVLRCARETELYERPLRLRGW
jgi:hypothetical protein